MKGAFMQAKQLIEQSFPGMEVVGSTYPISPLKQGLAQVVGLGQMGGFAFVIFGERIFESLGYAAPPEFYVHNVQQNKFGVGVGVWFVGNFLQNQLISTGAFEVYYDGTLLFSKLAENRMPVLEELLGGISTQMTARIAESEAATLLKEQQAR